MLLGLPVFASSDKDVANYNKMDELIYNEDVDENNIKPAYEELKNETLTFTGDYDYSLNARKMQNIFINDDFLYQSSSQFLYEKEPNNKIEQANNIYLDYNIYGTITNYYFDIDYYKIVVPQSGKLNILGIWVSDLVKGMGWEDHLAIGLRDANGNSIAWCKYIKFNDGTAAQALSIDIIPGTYYIVVFQCSDYEYLYTNETYGFKAYMSDIISDVSVTSISLDKSNTTISKGSTETLTATVYPANATNKSVTWSSNNPSVATVNSNGTITAVGTGTAIITVKTVDGGKTAACTVTVTEPIVSVTSVVLNKSNITISKGSTETLTAIVYPANATNKSVTWSSNNPSVATVNSNGVVTAVGAGTAIITVRTVDGNQTATCSVAVTETNVPVASVSLNKSSVTITKGNTETLTATVYPVNATNKILSWVSSSTSVATVDSNGIVTAVGTGTATITVIAASGGKSASCTVTVTDSSGPDVFTEWDPVFNVPVDKTWNVTFNLPLDISTIKEHNIYVTDKNNTIIPMLYYQGSQSDKNIYIIPVKNYNKGETYTLWIKDLKAQNGQILKKNIKMNFTTIA